MHRASVLYHNGLHLCFSAAAVSCANTIVTFAVSALVRVIALSSHAFHVLASLLALPILKLLAELCSSTTVGAGIACLLCLMSFVFGRSAFGTTFLDWGSAWGPATVGAAVWGAPR